MTKIYKQFEAIAGLIQEKQGSRKQYKPLKIDYSLISSPIFISGHTRSGTTLLMRMLDGNPDIVIPPRKGKLHILRRFAMQPHRVVYNSKDSLKILSKMELKLSNENEKKFLKLLEFEIGKNGEIHGIIELINVLISTILNYTGQKKCFVKRWLEKNHNLEFYWGRAKFLFANPKLIYVVRDPRDVWASWKKYCIERKMPNDLDQAILNIQNHMLNEVIEWAYKINRFSTQDEFIQYYNIEATSFNKLIDMLMNIEITK
ncbi:MAG: sulfotransferase, partial [Prolixibacteraceae bacterium]|nr:sulfotransferase [Prolixibacteraceae bacterium]